jgi:hypothetical protein
MVPDYHRRGSPAIRKVESFGLTLRHENLEKESEM